MSENTLGEYGINLVDLFPMAYVSLTISDLEKSLEFYQSVLGLDVLLKEGQTAVVGTIGGRPLILLNQQNKAISREPGATGIDHFALLVPNRIELARHLTKIKERNHPISTISDHGVNESIYIHDPDGTLVEITRDLTAEELVQHRPLRPQELSEQLLNLTSHSGFSEMSRDRRIGHVLLRVANLSEAEQYYVGGLGFRVTMRIPGAVFVSSGSYHHHLGFHVWESEGGAPPDPSAIGLRYYGIFVENNEIQNEMFIRMNNSFEYRFEQDPSGNGILLTKKMDANPQKLIDIDQHFSA